jgi:hypothetical protein
MNKSESTAYVKAERYSVPFDVWEFTALDRACLRMVIRGTWIFDTAVDVDLLKDALAKTLSYYPHLAGRMKNQAGITLTNDGVPFSTADEPELMIEDVLKRDDLANIKSFSTEIKTARLQKGFDAPLSVKLTSLKNGSVLGIQCSHACMDGDSFYTMVYNWGLICRGKSIEQPVLDQSLLPKAGDSTAEEIKAAAIEAGWKKLSIFSIFKLLPAVAGGLIWKRLGPFKISAATIKSIKERVTKDTGISCSSNLALSALITRRCMDLYKHGENARCSVVSVINTRRRLAAIPATYTGNSSLSIATPPFPADASISELAEIINRTLEPARKTPSPELQKLVELNLNAMKYKLSFAPFDVFGMHAKKPTIVYLNNFSKLHIYDIDFGLGLPVRVIPHNLYDQVLIWPAPPTAGGVEVYFSGVPIRYVSALPDNLLDNSF